MRSIVVIALLLCVSANAGDWQPDSMIAYSVVVPSDNSVAATAEEDRWVDSLQANLTKGGAHPNVVYRFGRSTAMFTINGAPQEDSVYVSRDDAEVYLVARNGVARFIINFKTREVHASGYGGHVFVPTSKAFCVIVLEAKEWPPRGIPITSAPGNEPNFRGRSVSWN